jgi:hypothetical protein
LAPSSDTLAKTKQIAGHGAVDISRGYPENHRKFNDDVVSMNDRHRALPSANRQNC